jgi:hypothetical protein
MVLNLTPGLRFFKAYCGNRKPLAQKLSPLQSFFLPENCLATAIALFPFR